MLNVVWYFYSMTSVISGCGNTLWQLCWWLGKGHTWQMIKSIVHTALTVAVFSLDSSSSRSSMQLLRSSICKKLEQLKVTDTGLIWEYRNAQLPYFIPLFVAQCYIVRNNFFNLLRYIISFTGESWSKWQDRVDYTEKSERHLWTYAFNSNSNCGLKIKRNLILIKFISCFLRFVNK